MTPMPACSTTASPRQKRSKRPGHNLSRCPAVPLGRACCALRSAWPGVVEADLGPASRGRSRTDPAPSVQTRFAADTWNSRGPDCCFRVLASIPVTDPRALARDDERERGSRLPLRCEGSRLRPFAERADDYRPGRTGTLAPLRRHTRATRSGLEGTRRFGRDPSYHVPNNRPWRSLLRAHSWAWRSVRCYCSSGECESEPGAQEDSRTSSATGASPTGTRALARGLKRARGALLSARSEAAAAVAGMLLSR
jgi:hypothetical protein